MAIAYDAAQGRNNGTGTSATLVVAGLTGSNRLLVVSVLAEATGTTVSAIDFAGVAMTQLATTVDTDDGAQMFNVWYLANPATSGTITATLSGSTNWNIFADSYTGVDQTTPFANGATGGSTPSFIDASPVSITVASNLDGSWHFVATKEDSASAPVAIAVGGVNREFYPGTGTITQQQFDSGIGIASGSNSTITLTYTGGGQKMGWFSQEYFKII